MLYPPSCTTALRVWRLGEALAEIQDFYTRLALGARPGAPRLSLRADFRVKNVKLRIWREKIMLIHHIRRPKEEALLASEMFREQVRNNWPGLAEAKEADDICKQLGIENVNETVLSKSQFSQLVDRAIDQKEDQMLKEESENMQKMKVIRSEDWGLKEYV